MKLCAYFIATAAAGRIRREAENSSVHAIGNTTTGHARISQCQDQNGQVEMVAFVDKTEFVTAPSSDWDDAGDEWTRTFTAAELTKAVDKASNKLVLYTTLNVDNVGNFFRNNQHSLAFKCHYDLSSQMVEQTVHITSEGVHDATPVDFTTNAALSYTLHFDAQKFKLGDRVNFSVVPKNPGLVYTRVTHCKVTNDEESYTIFGTPEYPYCADKFTDFLPPSLPYQGTSQLQKFSFLAFKWHDTSSSLDEEQKVSCNIELSAEPFSPLEVRTCDGQELVTNPTTVTQAPPGPEEDTTADVEVTPAPTSATTASTTPVAICNKWCEKIKQKIEKLRKQLENMSG